MATPKITTIKISSFLIFFSLLIPNSLSYPLPTLPETFSDNADEYYYSSSFPTTAAQAAAAPPPPLGWWTLLHRSIGISAMHMQLLNNDHVVMFDRTDFGPSNLTLPPDKCRSNNNDDESVLFTPPKDCTAHSVLYDVVSNVFRPLTIHTDTWCSSGSVDPTGMLVQTGGYALGERVVRTFSPCVDSDPTSTATCDWEELRTALAARRWYASNHILPDGHVIVVGGRGSPNYEFFPSQVPKKYPLRFLSDTWDGKNKENNLYPFLHLLPNNHLFIFANNRSIEFNYFTGKVVRNFPIMPSGDKRNYPSTGSSALLPIIGENLEILVCGGASPESFDLAQFKSVYVAASKTCGRMVITDPNPHWNMEEMPMPRVMPDMVMLPTGDILIINGAGNGTAGWENAANPVLNPVLYRVNSPDPTRRFLVLNPTEIPRMYHSSVVLVADGRVVVGGSNPHRTYNFTRKYPTELSLEGFSPPYLDPSFATLRPTILTVETEGKVVNYGQMVGVNFVLGRYRQELGLAVTMLLPPFTTHSYGMNQRLIVLGAQSENQVSEVAYKVTVRMPLNVNVAPPGFYLLFVVHAGVPSHGVWVQLKRSPLQ